MPHFARLRRSVGLAAGHDAAGGPAAYRASGWVSRAGGRSWRRGWTSPCEGIGAATLV